mmetsp:Transcript_20507/g.57360  ORF Transcript_20507/g.57360 Transcript_20507/m.57360 type:complete len:296 (-) Transcript_20507:230-1117(-)
MAAGQAGFTPRQPTNPLLQKDIVGRARPSCYDLPQDTFSYGRPGNQDAEGAREVSMRWVDHTPSRGPEEFAPDFIHLHKKAASARITTAKDLKHYRKEYDITQTPRMLAASAPPSTDAAKGGPKPLVPSDVIPGFTYGRKVRPSTPIHEVLSYRFGEKAEREMQRFNEKFEMQRAQQQSEVRRIPLTNASRGHASAAKKAASDVDEPKELFKIAKFTKNATPKIDSNINTPRLRTGMQELNSGGYADYLGELPEPSAASHHGAYPSGSAAGSELGSIGSGGGGRRGAGSGIAAGE